jgi:hypothetical protein
MSSPKSNIERLVHEVLSGELQERYIESGTIQMHPNYAPNPMVYPIESLYGTAKETKRAIQAAFIIRWAGFDYKSHDTIDEEQMVPNLFDADGEPLSYSALDAPKTVSLLDCMSMIESEAGAVTLTTKMRRVIRQHPQQVPTVMPRQGRFGVKSSMREGIRVHRLYNEVLYGKGAHIPLGETTSNTSVDRRRRGFKVIKNDE